MRKWVVLGFLGLCTSVWGQTSAQNMQPARQPAALFPPDGELAATVAPSEWFHYHSTLMGGSKILMEHLKYPSVRGIVSTQWNTFDRKTGFNRVQKLESICTETKKRYESVSGFKVLRAGVEVAGDVSFCRVAVQDAGERITEQLIYLSRRTRRQEDGLYLAHTLSFFYPGERTPEATPLIQALAKSIRRTGTRP